jgi:DNA-binding IclR family transcriptional regulator
MNAPKKTQQLAPALSRGIQILELLSIKTQGLSLTDIAAELKLAKSTVFGLCKTLLEADLVERSSDGSFRLGLRVLDYANARIGSLNISKEFHSAWDSLGVFRQEAVVMSVRDKADVVYLVCRNSPLPLGVTFKVGMRLPASCTATGKALLATLADAEIRALYHKQKLIRLTKSSVASVDALLRQLDQVRKTGVSMDDGETREHMCSFGAPIYDFSSQSALAGVAISFFKTDLSNPVRAKAIETVREFAKILSRNVGGNMHHFN